MTNKKIGTWEAIFLVVIIMTNKLILNLPKRIILSTGSSAWINTIYISIIAILFTLLLVKLFKRFEGYDILDISHFLGGKYLKIFAGILYIILLVTVPILILRDFSESLQLIYYKNSPISFILFIFIIGAVFANKFDFKGIVKTNLILVPFLLISIIILFFSSAKDFEIQRLFPILGYGATETFVNGLSNIFSFSIIAYLLFLPPSLSKVKDFKKISIISVVISALYLLIAVVCLLLVFPFIFSTNEPISIYLLTRMIDFGRFFQRVDALFLLIWMISIFSYISISLHFLLYVFKKITNITNSKNMAYCFGAIFFGFSLMPKNIAQFNTFVDIFFKYTVILVIFIISFLILILANFKKKKLESRLDN